MRIITERDMRAGLCGAQGMRGPHRTGEDGGRGAGLAWAGWCAGLARACGTDSVDVWVMDQ
jgi:hypothetical protein